jgi:hypothetical protein
MDQKTLWQQYNSLPADVQGQLRDFLTFLQAKYVSEIRTDLSTTDLAHEPFVGMWSDRTDLADTRGWIRDRRKEEWRDR